jgi:hypothetical protein
MVHMALSECPRALDDRHGARVRCVAERGDSAEKRAEEYAFLLAAMGVAP